MLTESEQQIANRDLRDKQLKQNCEQYRKLIYDCIQSVDASEEIIADSIRNWAKDLEELFMLHDQGWAVNTIANVIMRSMKTVGIPESKFNYVHKALGVYRDKYIKQIDHSSIQSSEPSDKRQEDFIYKSKAQLFYDALNTLSKFNPSELLRSDAQNIAEKAITVKEAIIEINDACKIPTCEPTSDDFEGIEDKYQEKVSYPPTKPAFTKLVEAWDRNLEARKDVRNRLYEEGRETLDSVVLLTDDDIEKMAEAIDADTHIFKPFTDRKWRRDINHWFDIVQHSIDWFKHSASTNNQAKDFQGFWRGLTREQIGARKPTMLKYAKKIVELTPYQYLLSSIWWEKTAIPRGAQFSRELSPKLSDRSIK